VSISINIPSLSTSTTKAPSLGTIQPSKSQTLYERCILAPARNLVRPFFLPLFGKIPSKLVNQMKKEEQYFQGFWDPKASLSPELSHHKLIKEHFTCRNKDFAIVVKGRPCTMRCFVIEPKLPARGQEYRNIVHVLGINSSINNTIMHTYPLLASYLDVKGEKPSVRFVLFNHYSITAADGSIPVPDTLSETGLILSETLKAIEEEFGTIHQLLSYSLGGIVTAAALKYFHREPPKSAVSLVGRVTSIQSNDATALKTTRVFKSLPKNIVFDRVPCSIEKVSTRYTGGSVLLRLAKLSGWDLNVGKEISNFILTCKNQAPSITIINAMQDHRFSGDVNLSASPEIGKLAEKKKVTSLLLDICQQSIHQNAQHSLSLGSWYGSHLVNGQTNQTFLSRDQSLASAIVHQALV
jgi:hypothetical protein